MATRLRALFYHPATGMWRTGKWGIRTLIYKKCIQGSSLKTFILEALDKPVENIVEGWELHAFHVPKHTSRKKSLLYQTVRELANKAKKVAVKEAARVGGGQFFDAAVMARLQEGARFNWVAPAPGLPPVVRIAPRRQRP